MTTKCKSPDSWNGEHRYELSCDESGAPVIACESCGCEKQKVSTSQLAEYDRQFDESFGDKHPLYTGGELTPDMCGAPPPCSDCGALPKIFMRKIPPGRHNLRELSVRDCEYPCGHMAPSPLTGYWTPKRLLVEKSV